jgi:hypothetical protein
VYSGISAEKKNRGVFHAFLRFERNMISTIMCRKVQTAKKEGF